MVLKKLYNIISLKHYLLFREEKIATLPEKSLIITFDDGHKSNYLLLPILKKYHIPITIFLCSEIIDTNKQFWFNYCKNRSIDLDILKKMDDNERIEYLNSIGFKDDSQFEERSALNYKEIKEMSEAVDFQSHTMTHPILTACENEKSYVEINNSKEKLEKILNKEICAIAYPNGDFSDREIEYVKQCNYKLGLTIINGSNNKYSEPFKLKRISLDDDNTSIDELIVKTSGIWFYLKKLLELFFPKFLL